MATLPDAELDLTEASLIIALEEYPGLEVGEYVERVGQWSEAIRERVDGSRDIERLVDAINRFLFDEEGFHGESGDYYDPRYTFLNEVLDHHAGLPMALSIVYIEISRRLGIEAAGVALPGRFLVKASGAWGEILIDPSEGGRVLSTVECQQIMDEVFGGGVRLREHHLRSFSRHEILARMLAHLKAVFLARHDLERAHAFIDRLLILDERDPWETHDRGMVAMQLHRYEEALVDLERYLEMAPHAEDGSRIREQIAWLRGWLDRN
ncbi:MAG TPA: tetratricopeptide repeat protein [Thermoanaerobaculia bacterium]|nr:tetratricopeptide repeat protein [Thermoanaerobaculia bacterium]